MAEWWSEEHEGLPGRPRDSVAGYRGALELDPLSALLHEGLAGLLGARKGSAADFEAAEASQLAAVLLDPTSAIAQKNLGFFRT